MDYVKEIKSLVIVVLVHAIIFSIGLLSLSKTGMGYADIGSEVISAIPLTVILIFSLVFIRKKSRLNFLGLLLFVISISIIFTVKSSMITQDYWAEIWQETARCICPLSVGCFFKLRLIVPVSVYPHIFPLYFILCTFTYGFFLMCLYNKCNNSGLV